MVLIASLCNVAMLCWGYTRKEKLLEKWAVWKSNIPKQAIYVVLKVLVLPVWFTLVLVVVLIDPAATFAVRWILFAGLLISIILFDFCTKLYSFFIRSSMI